MITKFDATWIGGGYETPRMFALKSEIGKQNPGVRSLRLVFSFTVGHVLMNERCEIQMKNGNWIPCFDFFCADHGRLIGPQDMACADNTKLQSVWRGLCLERRTENNFRPQPAT